MLTLETETYDLIADTIRTLEADGRFAPEKSFLQHGTTSVYEHSINVAYMSIRLARFLKWSVDDEALIRRGDKVCACKETLSLSSYGA